MKVTLEIVVPVEVEVLAEVGPLPVATEITRSLTDWSDGRYGFSAELLHAAVGPVIVGARSSAIESMLFERYGNEMVDTGNGSQTSRACLEAEKLEAAMHAAIPHNVEVKTDEVRCVMALDEDDKLLLRDALHEFSILRGRTPGSELDRVGDYVARRYGWMSEDQRSAKIEQVRARIERARELLVRLGAAAKEGS